MINVVSKNRRDPRIYFENVSFLLVSNERDLVQQELSSSDAIYLDTTSVQQAQAFIRTIRNTSQASIYLKPLFIPTTLEEDAFLITHSDGASSKIDLKQAAKQTVQINKRLESVYTAQPANEEYKRTTVLKWAQYLFTRNTTQQPIADRTAQFGYTYPFLSLFFKNSEAEQLIQTIQLAEQEQYLISKVLDTAHCCSDCSSSYVHFRETCPSCSSIDITTDDMIHHFPCAYVGPEKDFIKDDELACPKCDKKLRHIGIDYDKPSSIHTCSDCKNSFQQTAMEAKCIDCSSTMEIDHLIDVPISSYALSSRGEQIVCQPSISTNPTSSVETSHKKPSIPSVISQTFYELMLQKEQERINKNNGLSSEIVIQLKNELIQTIPESMRVILLEEMSKQISNYIQATDVVTIIGQQEFRILCPDQSNQAIEQTAHTMYNNLELLIQDNLNKTDGVLDLSLIELSKNNM